MATPTFLLWNKSPEKSSRKICGKSSKIYTTKIPDTFQSRFLGRGCDEALFSEKKGVFCEKGGGNSVNQGFGKDFYRKGNSVKRFGPFTEAPDSEN